MIINKLELYNFMSYKGCTLDMSPLSLCSIIGPNGAGKSAIIESIMWALYGNAKLGNKDLIHSGAEDMEVDLSFTIDDKRYDIVRTYGDSMRVKATVNGEALAQGNLNLTTALAKAIGSSRDMLMESVIISQGQLSSFINATPAQRRDLIMSILNLGKYAMAHETAKEALRDMTVRVESHNGTVSTIQEQINKIPEANYVEAQIVMVTAAVENCTKRFEELTKKREAIIARDSAANEKIKTLSTDAEVIKVKISKINQESEREINKVQASLRTSDQQTSEIDSMRSSLTILENDLASANATIEHLKELRNQIINYEGEIKKRRDKMVIMVGQNETCPLCGSHIGNERWTTIIKTMESELAEFVSNLDKVSREVQTTKLPGDPSKINDQLIYTRERIAKLETMKESRHLLQEQIDRVSKQRDEMVAELTAELEKTIMHLDQLKSMASAELIVVSREIEDVQKSQVDNSQKLSEWASFKQLREKLELSLQDSKNNLKLFRDKLPETQFVADALSPSGIPLMVVDHYLPAMETRAQELLHTMSDGLLNLKLEVVEGGTKKGIELQAGGSHLRPIKALSGGEQTRVSLALRVALSQILSEMSGTRFDCLLIDEPEYLDEAGIFQFIQAVVSLRSQYQQIFVMSHHNQIKSAFSQHIVVEKAGNISRAEVNA